MRQGQVHGSVKPIESSEPGFALLLRPWTEADAVGLREAIDEDVDHLKPWLSWTLEEPATLEQTRQRLVGYIDQFRSGTAFRYAINARDRPRVILGGAGLSCRFGPGAHDIGYWVRKSAVRQGIATAATSRLAVTAFARPDLKRLIIQCDVANTRSAAMARTLGFEFTGAATTEYPDGTPRPVYRFELSREGYAVVATILRERGRRVHITHDTSAAWPR